MYKKVRKILALTMLLCAVFTLCSIGVSAEETSPAGYAAEAVIAKIDAIGEITVDAEDRINEARIAYTALTDEQKGLVTNYEVLLAAEEELSDMKGESNPAKDPDAEAVDELITKIGTVTLDSEEAISAARSAYNALTDAQKLLVENYATLAVAERTYTELKLAQEAANARDQAAASIVDIKINAIGEVTAVSGEIIKAARDGYNGLTDEQKALVKDLAVLETAEKTYTQLVEKKQADETAAAAVDDKIAAIGEVTAASGETIKAARDGYNGLTDEQKTFVKNLATLEAAERVYDQLVAKEKADEAAAAAVDGMITAVGEVTSASGEAIKTAREAYDALTDGQKTLVKNLAVLETAEKSYAQLVAKENEAAAADVDEKITAIGEVTAASGEAIKAARDGYDGLTDEQKALVKNLATLEAAEGVYAQFVEKEQADAAAAAAVDDLINTIGEVTAASGETIKTARDGYNGLSEEQKALVKTLEILEAAEKTYLYLVEKENDAAAAIVDIKIIAIGDAANASGDKIKAARDAYEALTEEQKALVKNLDVLEAAERVYAQSDEKKKADETAAAIVDIKISAIGEVTSASGNIIKIARDAYNELTDEQKALVTNYEVLKAAEKAYLEQTGKEAGNKDSSGSIWCVILAVLLTASVAGNVVMAVLFIKNRKNQEFMFDEDETEEDTQTAEEITQTEKTL